MIPSVCWPTHEACKKCDRLTVNMANLVFNFRVQLIKQQSLWFWTAPPIVYSIQMCSFNRVIYIIIINFKGTIAKVVQTRVDVLVVV